MFMLPKSVIDEVEGILRRFLWKGSNLGYGGVKVSWSDVCKPKSEGGLGLVALQEWNKALLAKHIWNLFNDGNLHCGRTKYSSTWIEKEDFFFFNYFDRAATMMATRL